MSLEDRLSKMLDVDPERRGEKPKLIACDACGKEFSRKASACPHCGNPNMRSGRSDKSWVVTVVLCLFLGNLGIHRFYTGHTLIGILYLLTLGLCFLGSLFDLFLLLIGGYTDDRGRQLT